MKVLYVSGYTAEGPDGPTSRVRRVRGAESDERLGDTIAPPPTISVYPA